MVTSTAFNFKGVVNSWNDLPGDVSLGEIYSVSSTGDMVVYAHEGWEPLGSVSDMIPKYAIECDDIIAYDRHTPSISVSAFNRGEFRTHCRCCGSLMPRTEGELNTCEHCGATQNTFEYKEEMI